MVTAAVHLKFSEPGNVEYNEVFLLICDEDLFKYNKSGMVAKPATLGNCYN